MSLRENASRAARRLPTRWTATFATSRTNIRPANSPPSATSSPTATNKDRKKPFDIRTVMRSVVDQDHPVLERWADMADADTSVVFDAHVGGIPVCVIGIESRVIPRKGWCPGRRAGPVDVGNPFPAVLEEDRSRDQRRKRKPTPGGAGEPFGFRRFAGVTPQDPARARRRNRPGHRQLRRTDRVRAWSRAITAELSWSSPTR